MANGFLDEYYALELAYNGHVEDIPDEQLEALRTRYMDELSDISKEPKPHVKKELSERMIQIKKLWDQGLTVEEMAEETKLSSKSIRSYLTQLRLPSNSIYHYRITRGEEIYSRVQLENWQINLILDIKVRVQMFVRKHESKAGSYIMVIGVNQK